MAGMDDGTALRVGVIGADAKASWAGLAHVPALAALPGVRLAAVATRSEDSARAAAEALGSPRWFGDPLALIASDDVDVVTVAVRVPAHRDLVLAALAAGKPVYCEAPLGRDVAESEEMAAAATAAGVPTAIGLQGRSNPALRRAAALVASGAIGRPLAARVVSTSGGFGPAFPATYDYFNHAESGANLSTIAVAHTLDALEAVLGPIEEVEARSAVLWPEVLLTDTGAVSRRETADQVAVMGRAAGGCVFVADVNGGVAPEDARFDLELRGSDGWLRLTGGIVFGYQGGDLRLTAGAPFDPPDAPAVGGAAPPPAINVGEVYASLARDVRAGTRLTPGFDHALRSSRLIAAVTAAAREGQRRTVPA